MEKRHNGRGCLGTSGKKPDATLCNVGGIRDDILRAFYTRLGFASGDCQGIRQGKKWHNGRGNDWHIQSGKRGGYCQRLREGKTAGNL